MWHVTQHHGSVALQFTFVCLYVDIPFVVGSLQHAGEIVDPRSQSRNSCHTVTPINIPVHALGAAVLKPNESMID